MNGEKEGSVTDLRNMKTVCLSREGGSKASPKHSRLDSSGKKTGLCYPVQGNMGFQEAVIINNMLPQVQYAVMRNIMKFTVDFGKEQGVIGIIGGAMGWGANQRWSCAGTSDNF